MKRRIMSILLALLLMFTCIPVNPVLAAEATYNEPTLVVESKYAASGTSVEVNISVVNNPGVAGAKFSVSYNDKLTLVDAVSGDTFATLDYTAPPNFSSSCYFNWDSLDTEVTEDGVLLTLVFETSSEAVANEELNVEVTYRSGDIYNINLDSVELDIVNGCIMIINYLPGDINGDKVVNGKDVTLLRRYNAGYNVTINEDAADVNDDNVINGKDVTLIRRYNAGYPVELKPHTPRCSHTMEAITFKAATCTDAGNLSYYRCTTCDKYYNDSNGTVEIGLANTVLPATGHTAVTLPAVEPTYTSPGKTEGSQCSVCKEILVKQEDIPPLVEEEYIITYKLPSNDTYLVEIGAEKTNPNPKTYTSQAGVERLEDLNIPGYDFYGWYTEPAGGGTRVNRIAQGTTGTQILYAHMKEHVYDVTYKLYQTPLGEITREDYLHYTVSKGLKDLPNPEINNYIFLGWYTSDGTEVTEIPVGTTNDITLNAYWTSKRNQAIAVDSLEDPIIIENSDDGVIYFAYELGIIDNVPLSDAIWTIQSVSGLAQQKSETVSVTISEERASEIAKTISNSTVDSATWTLSQDWNDVTEVIEEWAQQNGMTQEEANEKTKSSSGTFSITSSNGGCDTTTITDGTTAITYDSRNYTHGNGAEFNAKIGGSYSNKGNLSSKIAGTFEVSGELSGGYEQHKETDEHSGTDTTDVYTEVTTGTSTWNTATTSSNTNSASESVAVKKALSQVISNTKGYGKSYSSGGENSESQGFSSTDSKSVNSSSSLTYFTSETKTITQTQTTDGKSEGCYRLVIAGSIHVFGVVGYDVASHSYFTYTFNVLDEKTKEFLDYSPNLNFNDYENGVLPFEIPYFVHEYVSGKIASTKGLQFETDSRNGTAKVIGYDNDVDTDVIVPSYISSGNTSYKVTGISENVFAGKPIKAIMLSDYINEIPDGAFKNCNALEQVSGFFTVIGDEAFSGCISLENFTVSAVTTEIGTDAFKNVPSVKVRALSADAAIAKAKAALPSATEAEQLLYAQNCTRDVVNSAVAAGAQNLVLDISNTIEDVVYTLDVAHMSSFELLGGKRNYKDMCIKSAADTTILKELTISECTRIPLEIASSNLSMEVVNVESQGYALLLSNETPKITLIRDNNLTALSGEAVVCRVPEVISKTVDMVSGKLYINGNLYVNGTSEEIEQLQQLRALDVKNGEFIPISDSEYSQYIKGAFNVIFDANGGSVDETSRVIFCGTAIGTLPIPTLTGHNFDGWFTEDDIQVKEDTIFSVVSDVKLTAKWSAMSYKAKWDVESGYMLSVDRIKSPYANAEIATLSNGADVYFGDELNITYTAKEGYMLSDMGQTQVTVTEDITSSIIYATAVLNTYTVSWNFGTGYSILVNRIDSPLAAAPMGTLSNGDKIYYGDILEISYSVEIGYILESSGKTNIVVDGDVTSNDIYASVKADNYTYNIIYKSSNGTDLGNATATYRYGTTNTIYAPAIAGYDVPGPQDVTWDSTSAKTITFTYTPTYLYFAQDMSSGEWRLWENNKYGVVYGAYTEFQNRTANSIQIRVVWQNTLRTSNVNTSYGYNQYFSASIGGQSTGDVLITSSSTWASAYNTDQNVVAVSNWVTVPVSPMQTSVAISANFWDDNPNNSNKSWQNNVTIPTY